MTNNYDEDIVEKIVKGEWVPKDFAREFVSLGNKIDEEVAISISGKIASMLMMHQILHQFTKDLIRTSNIYIQGELWPVRFSPEFDGGEEKMTGWYIAYLKNNTIEFLCKNEFINEVSKVNSIRNKVAHNLVGKNEVIITDSYIKLRQHYLIAVDLYIEKCLSNIASHINDLKTRVDFNEIIKA